MSGNLLKTLDEAVNKLLNYPLNEVLIIHHDDADGISSGAIIYEALRRKGFKPKLVCIEKLMPQIIEYIHSGSNKIIFYVDIASPHADRISSYNQGRNLVVILDHHDPKPSTDEMVININPEFYGYEGEVDASGSIMTYLFAKHLDKDNIDLSKIALIGAQELPSQNGFFVKEVYRDAEEMGLDIDLKEMFKTLQILGSVGYYQNGPELGVKACLEGLNEDIRRVAKELEEKRKAANRKMLAILYRKGLNKTRYIQWFDSFNIYNGMGTKVIGTFCSYLSYQRRIIDNNRYIIGIMKMPNIIPGLMELKGKWLKISGRAPEKVRKLISGKVYPGIVDVMVAAAEKVGGVGDGHQYAASVVIPEDEKMNFINLVDEEISSRLK